MAEASSDVVFTPTIKTIQTRKGSRERYRRIEEQGGFNTAITNELASFIAGRTTVFLATANLEGQPYVQHRGGPPGFLHVLDEHTIAFVDYSGNRQFITQGNLLDNPRAQLFLIDYANQARVKVWGTARVVEGDDAMIAALMPDAYAARPEQVILFTVTAWNGNCRAHIPRLLDPAIVTGAIASRDQRIAALEAEVVRLRAEAGSL